MDSSMCSHSRPRSPPARRKRTPPLGIVTPCELRRHPMLGTPFLMGRCTPPQRTSPLHLPVEGGRRVARLVARVSGPSNHYSTY
jgi:hypothetical protein